MLNNDFCYMQAYSTVVNNSYQTTKYALSTKITTDNTVNSSVDFTWQPGTSIISKHQWHAWSTTIQKIPQLIIGNDSGCCNGLHNKMQSTTPCRCGCDWTNTLDKTTVHRGMLPPAFLLCNGHFSNFTFSLTHTENKHRGKSSVIERN